MKKSVGALQLNGFCARCCEPLERREDAGHFTTLTQMTPFVLSSRYNVASLLACFYMGIQITFLIPQHSPAFPELPIAFPPTTRPVALT